MTMKIEIYSDNNGERRELAEMEYEDNLHIVIDGVDYCVWADTDNKLIVSAEKKCKGVIHLSHDDWNGAIKIGEVKK